MKNKVFRGIIFGMIGLVVGALAGGYLGLIIGGTFLGSFNIYEQTGLEGYQISAYVGAVLGAIVVMILGVKFSLKKYEKK